jgi:hypothetical protein
VDDAIVTQFFSDGFESGDFSAWTGINGSPSLVSSPAHQGTNTMEITVKGAYIYKNITGISTVHVRVYWRLNGEIAAGSGSSQRIALMHLRPGANGYIVYVRNEGGLLQWGIRSLFGTTFWVWSTQQTPVIGTWYCVELAVVLNAGAGSATLYVNGSELTDITRSGLNNTGTITTVRVGQEDSYGNNYTAHWDDVVFSDSYIGPEADSTLQTVADVLQGVDAVYRHKSALAVVDLFELSDGLLGNKSLFLAEHLSAEDLTLRTCKAVLVDSDVIGIVDVTSVDKRLIVSESAGVVEAVEVGMPGRKKTRLFLVLGDLAIQINSD